MSSEHFDWQETAVGSGGSIQLLLRIICCLYAPYHPAAPGEGENNPGLGTGQTSCDIWVLPLFNCVALGKSLISIQLAP